MADGRFREDLYHRLNVVPLRVPGLAERRDDIPQLIQFFVKQVAQSSGLAPRKIGEDAIAVLQAHDWPGNVRELRNVIEHAVVVCEGQRIEKQHLPPAMFDERALFNEDSINLPIPISLDEAERQLILKTLIKTNNNKTRAADLLQISLKTLHNKLKAYREENEE
jgi:two-component system nitrogen regulation response regulator NtrX